MYFNSSNNSRNNKTNKTMAELERQQVSCTWRDSN